MNIDALIAAINSEIAEHIELRKEFGAGNQNVVSHSAKLSGMVEALEIITGVHYRQTPEGLVRI